MTFYYFHTILGNSQIDATSAEIKNVLQTHSIATIGLKLR